MHVQRPKTCKMHAVPEPRSYKTVDQRVWGIGQWLDDEYSFEPGWTFSTYWCLLWLD